MRVCYIQTRHPARPGDRELMKGQSAGVLFATFAALITLMAHNARSQSRSASTKTPASRGKVASKRSATRLSPAAKQWIESTLRRMSLEEKIGQLLFTTYHGSFTASDSA